MIPSTAIAWQITQLGRSDCQKKHLQSHVNEHIGHFWDDKCLVEVTFQALLGKVSISFSLISRFLLSNNITIKCSCS